MKTSVFVAAFVMSALTVSAGTDGRTAELTTRISRLEKQNADLMNCVSNLMSEVVKKDDFNGIKWDNVFYPSGNSCNVVLVMQEPYFKGTNVLYREAKPMFVARAALADWSKYYQEEKDTNNINQIKMIMIAEELKKNKV